MTERVRAFVGVIEREWHALEEQLNAAPAGAFDRPVFAGEGEGWRLRDLLAHVVFWQDLAARAAKKMAAEGTKPQPEERLRDFVGETRPVDELNQAAVDASRARSVGELTDELKRAHAGLVESVRAVPQELLFTGDGPEDVVRVIWQPALNHLRHHRPHIEAAFKEGAISR